MVALKEFLRVSQIIAVSALAVTVLQGPALAQSTNFNQYQYKTNNDGYEIPIPPVVVPPPVYTPPAPPPPVVVPPPPPPVVVPPPEIPRIPVLPVVQTPHIPFLPQAIDLTNAAPNVRPNLPVPIPPMIGSASDGLQTIPNNQFPLAKNLKGKSDWILVRGEQSSVFQRPNPYTAKLEAGTILVSVRRPSDLALVLTPLGEIALHSDGDVLLTYTGDVLRIYNISALGNDCKVKFGREVIGENKSECVKLKVGFEIVASTHKLGRVDLRPADGVARRRAQLLNNGHMAISEFSVQSVLSNSAVIVQIAQQSTNAKEARVLSQMSKMAAVLNYVNSPYGYTVEGATGVASVPGKQPQ